MTEDAAFSVAGLLTHGLDPIFTDATAKMFPSSIESSSRPSRAEKV